MKFGPLPPGQAEGGILAHSMMLENGKRLRKGIKINAGVVSQLEESGVESVIIAMPQEGDVLEDAAAALIAAQLESAGLRIDEASTGRVNIFAGVNGIFRVSAEIIDAMNAIDPGITIATLPDYACVNEDRLVATIKIIPYAVSGGSLETLLAMDLSAAIGISAFKPKQIGMISTVLPPLKKVTMDKTRANLEARLALSSSTIVEERRVAHDEQAIAEAIVDLASKCDMLILFGASAISDIADCIPAAIESAGGEIIRFGMPVDPGNLMLLARLGDMPVIGAPGCARSIAENGFDWVLQRLLADIPVTSDNIASMGVGGLLMETGARPHPREKNKALPDKTAIIILAAGQSRRMGELNKMTVDVYGKQMVRHVGEAAKGASVDGVYVVTGHQPQEVLHVLSGLQVVDVHNPVYETGLSTSLAAGITSLSGQFSRAIVLLGDMPFITSVMVNDLIKASDDNPGHIIVSTHQGKRGNPVLWPRAFFDELQSIQGDVGARHIIGANQDMVIEVELGEAASRDLDTPEAVKAAQKTR